MPKNVPKEISRFKIHINNASQTVNAEDLNKLGLAVNAAESNLIDLSSESFKNKAFFALENNQEVNSLFLDDFESSNYINHFLSENLYYNTDSRYISIDPKPQFNAAKALSVKYISQVKGTVQRVILLVDDYVPKGAIINYYVATNDDDFMPIRKNQSVVSEIIEGPCAILRADMRKNAAGESPRIYGWALLYWDRVIAMLYSLKGIDVTGPQLDIEFLGTTVLIRDPLQKDRLIAVVEEGGLTELTYEPNGRLATVREQTMGGVFSDELVYGPYTYYDGRTGEVLSSINRTREPDLIS